MCARTINTHRRLFNYRQLFQVCAMQYYRTSSIHKWFWLHLSALYTANKSIPSYWWWCTDVLLFDWSRLIIEDWITILRFAYLTAMSTLNIAKMKEPRKKKHNRRLKSSVARLLKLTTYWILRTEHWSQCLCTRAFFTTFAFIDTLTTRHSFI